MASASSSSPPPTSYGHDTFVSPTPATFLTHAASNSTAFFATRRPWRELLTLSAFSRPFSVGEATVRIKRNSAYFRVNYAMVVLFILFLSLLWQPLSMIVFLIVLCFAWFFLFFFRDQPLVVLGRTVDDRLVLTLLAAVTLLALILTGGGIWLNVLVSVSIGLGIVVLHAAFRGTEDLYSDELNGGGLLSFVGGSPTKNGYSPI
ncbi:PRA1 family protein D [Linum grandiflorum]